MNWQRKPGDRPQTTSESILQQCRKLSRSSDPLTETEDLSIEVGVALSRVRKTSQPVRTRKSQCTSMVQASELKKKRENRLSAVIGKYIRPGGGKGFEGNRGSDGKVRFVNSKNQELVYRVSRAMLIFQTSTWQLDSSSWEFLGQDNNDADVSSSSSSSSASSRCPSPSPSSSSEESLSRLDMSQAQDDQDMILEEHHVAVEMNQTNAEPPSEAQAEPEADSGLDQPPLISGVIVKQEQDQDMEVCQANSVDQRVKAKCLSKDSVYESGNNDTMHSTNDKPAEEEDVVGVPSLIPKGPSTQSRQRIQGCVQDLANDAGTTFSRSLKKFVQCTEESREKDPAVVMRNMRQFMSGIKNYLLRHGEGDLLKVIDQERAEVLFNFLLACVVFIFQYY